MKRLILLDGHALLFRAFHAMPGLTTPDGRPSGGVYGVANVVVRVLRELEPTHVVACFDAPGKTFRDALYPDYKATRAETPPEVIAQEPMAKEALAGLAIPSYAVSGFEADDLIATLSKQALGGKFQMTKSKFQIKSKAQISNDETGQRSGVSGQMSGVDEVVIVTGDRDLLQLANSQVKVYLLRKGIKDIELVDGAGVRQLLGVSARELLDWKALVGDPSDNIIGVPGVGPKTAVELIQRFGNIEKLYKALGRQKTEDRRQNEIRDSIRKALLDHRERVFGNLELLKLRTDAPVTFDPAAADRSNYDPASARATLASFGFKTILDRLPVSSGSSQGGPGGQAGSAASSAGLPTGQAGAPSGPKQATLF